MAVLREINYWFQPEVLVNCKKDTDANLDAAAL